MLRNVTCALAVLALLFFAGLRYVHSDDDQIIFDEFPRMLTPADGVQVNAEQALFTAKALVARYSSVVWWTQGQLFTMDMYHNPQLYPGVLVDVNGVVAATLRYNVTEHENDPLVSSFGTRAVRATLLTDGGVALDCDLCEAYTVDNKIVTGKTIHVRGVVINKCSLADGQPAVRFVGIVK